MKKRLEGGWVAASEADLPSGVGGSHPRRLNRLIEVFESGKPAVGTFVFNICSRSAAALAGSPLDFVIIDMEHTPFDPTRLENYLLAMIDKRRVLAKGSPQPDVLPLVRVPTYGRERVQYIIKQVLDLGAFGIVAPSIETADEALSVVRAMRFAQSEGAKDFQPEGTRGVGYPWAARYWGVPEPDYCLRADLWPLDPEGELILWCMIETKKGIENCRAIASTPGIGGILIGPSDLSVSLEGRKGGTKVEDAILGIHQICKEVGILCGTVATPENIALRVDQGFDFLAVGADTGIPGSVERAIEIVRQGSAFTGG